MRAYRTLLTCMALSTCASFAYCEDQPTTGSQIETKVTEHDKSPCLGACTVNFRKELGSSLSYLDGIGLRIHEAAEHTDPVELAAAAKSLAVAEELSGKKAKVTSDQVMSQAVKLATLRQVPDELKGVAMFASDDATKTKLQKAAEEASAQDTGERSRAIYRSLIVTNHTGECLNIYVDGQYVGEAHENETTRLHVHSHRTPNHLSAYCMEGGEMVDHSHFFGEARDVNWRIYR